MNDALTAIGVSRRYGPSMVVEDVSLSLPAGTITALLGESGAGKSTLLRLFAGLEPVDTGEIRLGARRLSAPGETVAPEKRRIGLIFQDFALFPHLDVRRNIAFGLKPLAKAEIDARISHWLKRLGLEARAGAYPHELSGGEQQRVAIARALAPQPAAILMDEPFSGLDPSLRGSVRAQALGAVREAGIPALMVTHDPAEALEVADRIAILKDGRLLQSGAPDEIYLQPASPSVAAALGPVNRFRARDLPAGLLPETTAPDAEVLVRPEGVVLDGQASVRGRVTSRTLTGPLVQCVIACDRLHLTALVPRAEAPAAGTQTGIRFSPDLTFIFASGAT